MNKIQQEQHILKKVIWKCMVKTVGALTKFVDFCQIPLNTLSPLQIILCYKIIENQYFLMFTSLNILRFVHLIYVFRDGDPLSGIDDHLDVRFVQPSRVHLSPYPRYVHCYLYVYIQIT
jgi:hypothetical protein